MLVPAIPGTAQASSGTLDPSFGVGGQVTIPTTAGYNAQAVEAPDGKLLVEADNALHRYLPSGSLDPSFGNAGTVEIKDPEGLALGVTGLAVDREGRIVVFGTAVDQNVLAAPGVTYYREELHPSYAAVLRYTSEGKLDANFGGGDGSIHTDFGLPPSSPSGLPVATGGRGVVDSTGRPVFIGGEVQGGAGCGTFGRSAYWDEHELVARLTTDGRLDPSFGGGDGVEPTAPAREFAGVALGGAGEPLLAEVPPGSCNSHPATTLLGFGSDGSPDGGFGAGGERLLQGQEAQGLAVDGAGRILILGSPRHPHVKSPHGRTPAGQTITPVLRVTANGAPDPSFAHRGVATVRLPGSESSLDSIAADQHGRVLVAGTLSPSPYSRRHPRWATAVRLTASGGLDRSFGIDAHVATQFAAGAREAEGSDVLVDAQGSVVLVGHSWIPRRSQVVLGLARYLP